MQLTLLDNQMKGDSFKLCFVCITRFRVEYLCSNFVLYACIMVSIEDSIPGPVSEKKCQYIL